MASNNFFLVVFFLFYFYKKDRKKERKTGVKGTPAKAVGRNMYILYCKKEIFWRNVTKIKPGSGESIIVGYHW